MGLTIVVTVVLGLVQLAIAVPLLLILWLKRQLYRPPPLPLWARVAEVDDRLVLHLAAAIEGLSPGTMGQIAVAQAQAGDMETARALLARAETRLQRLSRTPRLLRWDDSLIPECERKRLSDAQQRFASVLLGQEQPPPVRLDPTALSWVREPVTFGGASRPPDPIRVLVAKGQFHTALDLARALPRDALDGQPAKSMAVVAVGQHEAGDTQGAAATLVEAVAVARRFSNIWPVGDDSGYRERALTYLAVLQVYIGDLKGARRTIAIIYDQDSADHACSEVALILAGQGERRAALELLWQIANKEQKAHACMRLAEIYRPAGKF
ncbi:hypothetical protein [Rubellimicrobium roseum]|uniref:Tetratricopeptide repeat protein n=1 Tax=Rubellimicrobium roseum TaxID=687525 RepID=A0A5C4N863_9RHOB|nr:hypothetical protein [Rubellimicrobium roseum]TNC60463.1 hypothetical protein FHG71_22070 [Rubellimicrobium roseum]